MDENSLQKQMSDTLWNLQDQIQELTQKKEKLEAAYNALFPGNIINPIQEKVAVVTPEKKPEKKKAKHKTGEKKMKYSQLVFSAMKPGVRYHSEDFVEKVENALKTGLIDKPKNSKPLKEQIGCYLYSFTLNGRVISGRDEGSNKSVWYMLPSADKEKETVPESNPDDLEEAILDILNVKRMNLPNLVSKIRLSESYNEISKNLNGTLAQCVESKLNDLVSNEIIEWTSDNEYKINTAK